MATVTFDKATRIYPGATTPAVDKLDLEIGDGEFLVLVGPSGCGKSTSLRMLAGLEDVNEGAIRIGDRDVTDLPPKDRDIAMVFQNYALYPHMSVAENMGFALKIAGVSKDEIKRRVGEAAKLLDLEEYLDRKPKALSGGQRQRVAMGRAIVREPQVFLMDEPLSNLDAKLRVQTRTQIAVAAAPARRHHRLRHARPDRGHDDGRPGGRAQGRHPAAGRHPARAVRHAGQRLRRRLHRLPRDEPRSRRPWSRAASRCRGYVEPLPREVMDEGGGAGPEDRDPRLPARGPADSPTDASGAPVEVVLVEVLGADAYVYGEIDLLERRQDRRSSSAPTGASPRPRATPSTCASRRTTRTCSPPPTAWR